MLEKFVMSETVSRRCRNRTLLFIFSIIVFHRSLTDATKYGNSSNPSTIQKVLLTLVVVEKPRLQNFNVYLARTGKPFEPSQIASPQPYNASEMILKFEKSKSEILNDLNISNQNDTRPKRSVFGLFNMISCATGCNPLTYKKYGCYCGFLGSGIAVDGIDKCCQHHDWCYSAADCPMWSEYFIPYYWICHRNEPLCGTIIAITVEILNRKHEFAFTLRRSYSKFSLS
ncbi:uncharacterized protein LOC112904032 [Agrilus planipennis]|uniref:Phospholipase A2 n=1 Tax=Agrilus planipennis TaxID=224129 RepID=A0A7F5R1I6_AGRPL|nr:uncharacterized protein LOC112904032 [Agrilus planipennis]